MAKEKDKTRIGITGKPIPYKNLSPGNEQKFLNKRREHLGPNVGGETYSGGSFSQHRMTGSRGHGSDYQNPRSVRSEEILVDYLLGEGFASDEKSASAIASAMSETWIQSIMEAKVDEKLPEHERSAARLKRYDNPSGALALGGGQQRARRAEHEERRGKKKN